MEIPANLKAQQRVTKPEKDLHYMKVQVVLRPIFWIHCEEPSKIIYMHS